MKKLNWEDLKGIIEDDFGSYVEENSKLDYNEMQGIEGCLNILKDCGQISEEAIRNAMYNHSIDKILKKVLEKFEQIYSYRNDNIEIIKNRTKGTLSVEIGENCIFFDRNLEDSLHEFFMVTMIWGKYIDDEDKYGRFFNYLTVVLIGIIQNKTCNIYSFEYIGDEIRQGTSIANVAVGCQYFCVYFCIAHEVAHRYLEDINCMTNRKTNPVQSEYQADSIAYHVVLHLMEDESKLNSDSDRELSDFCYLSPMMFFDFWELIFYVDRVIFKKYVENDDKHPEVKKRRDSLFNVPYEDEFSFDTDQGNDLYAGFLDVIDKYKTELLYREKTGQLNSLLECIGEAGNDKK